MRKPTKRDRSKRSTKTNGTPNTALEKLRAAGTRRAVASALGCSPSTLSDVLTGKRAATEAMREQARVAYGIEASEWPGALCMRDTAARIEKQGADRGTLATDLTPTERLEHALAEYDAALAGDLAPSTRVSLMRARDACAERLGRLQGTLINEQTIVRHPSHQRVMALVMSALTPSVLSVVRVRDALSVVQGEPAELVDKLRARHPELVRAVEDAEAELAERTGG
jgi:transcriptional regulator with XRE-family HTH domain